VPDNRLLNRQTATRQGGELLDSKIEETSSGETLGEAGEPSGDTVTAPSGSTPDHRKLRVGTRSVSDTRRKRR
jgi:hypothetical protein